MTEDEVSQLNRVVYAQDVFGTYDSEKILSYRYAIHGLLLNTELLEKADSQGFLNMQRMHNQENDWNEHSLFAFL